MFPADQQTIPPAGNPEHHTVQIGGRTAAELVTHPESSGIALNAHARTLLASSKFFTEPSPRSLNLVCVTVHDLGLPGGGTMPQILAAARLCGLALCPIETAPHWRLQYTDQPEGVIGQPVTQFQAPQGAITVAVAPLEPGNDFPRGFYLRRMEGVLCLRGYRSDDVHLWQAGHCFAFCKV
jgi:hypothetical protein